MAAAVRVGINGFGRIGRLTLRAIEAAHPGAVEVVAVNDLADAATNAFLLAHDSNYGAFPGEVAADGSGAFRVNGRRVAAHAERDPGAIPWERDGVDVVVESTGRFTDATKARAHRERPGVKRVVISAPAKNEDLTIVLGVNEDTYDPEKHFIVSNASCTTNGLAPVAKVLHDRFGVEKGLLTAIHAYTNSQATADTAAKDLRDARAAAQNVVPSSTGAAKAVGLVIPALKGRFTGMSFRVPVPTVSAVDFTAVLAREATAEEINDAHREAAASGRLSGILRYTEEPLVSSDLKGDSHSAIFSAPETIALGNLVKVVAWYDNEWGYARRVADLVTFLADRGL
jgi:glyceraldehyde-3-phosphate dehydrogenase, type I